MLTKNKKKNRQAAPFGRRRSDAKKLFKEYLIRIMAKHIPSELSSEDMERWKTAEGHAMLDAMFERMLSGLKGPDIPPSIRAEDIIVDQTEGGVASKTYKSQQEQIEFLDPGQADEKSWPAEKGGLKEESAADESPIFLRMPGSDIPDQRDATAANSAVVASEQPEEEQEHAPAISSEGLEEQFRSAVKEWREFYLEFFTLEIEEGAISIDDFTSLECPDRVSGLFQLIVVAKGLTPLMLYKLCMKFFPCRSRRNEDWQFMWNIESPRNSKNGSYSVWADRRLNSDKKFSGCSPATLKRMAVKTLNFEERSLHDLWRIYKDFKEKGVAVEQYEIKQFINVAGNGFMYEDMTLCDSTVNDPMKHPGNAVIYAWSNGAFAVWVWEPVKWELYQENIKKKVLSEIKKGDDREALLKSAIKEKEKRYFRDMHARQVSVKT